MKVLSRAAGHILPVIGGKITGGVIVGALIALTGFGPEHWLAEAFAHLGLPDLLARAKGGGVDLRLGLVSLGVAIVALDVFRRRRGGADEEQSAAPPAVIEPSVAALPTASQRSPDEIKRDGPPPLSLVVLPFQNLSDEPGQDYFVDGLTEDITTEMSRLSGAFVISRNTAFTYKGKPVDVKAVTRELNVRYALEGSVRKAGQSLRVSAQLSDGSNGKTLWAVFFHGIGTPLRG